MMEFDPVLVHDWLTRAAGRSPDKTALVCGDLRSSYVELDRASTRLARALVRGGVEKGERVVIFLENGPEAVISIYGILKAGGVFIVADAASTSSSLRHILTDSGARTLIAHQDSRAVVDAAMSPGGPECRILWVGAGNGQPLGPQAPDGDWATLIECSDDGVALPRVIDVDLAALIYTSGSTGRPKGIISTHHNIVSSARSIVQYLGNNESDVILDVLPLAFDYGLYQVIMAFMFGGTVVLERSMGFLETMMRKVEGEGVTGFPIVPSIGAMLLKLKNIRSERFASLRYISSTGAVWPAAQLRRLRALLPRVAFYSMYGLTECKRVSFLPPGLIDEKSGSVGRAMPNSEAFVVDDYGHAVPPGGTGELVVRGANVMQGYWNDRATTEQVFRDGRYPADRRLHTGDRFRLGEDGLLYFAGRRDDLIKTFGRRVSPREVEEVAAAMPGVAEAAAVAVPDEVGGQVVGVFVEPSEARRIDDNAVKEFCAGRLEPYKVPKHVWIVDAMPRTPNGKIDKALLKERLPCLSR